MKPREQQQPDVEDMFRSRLENIINQRHELVLLAKAIDWQRFDEVFEPLFCDVGSPGLPTRLMVGLQILKYMHGLSDPEVTAQWIQNPYFQYFCGEVYFQHKAPFDRSSMTRWRQRIGDEKLAILVQESLASAQRTGALSPKDVRRVTVDTTVQPKNITFPTDAKLLYTSIVRLNRLARRHGVKLRQSYLRVGKLALIKSQRYAHARQFRRQRREIKFLHVRLGRVIRDIERKTEHDPILRAAFESELNLAKRIRAQKKRQAGPKVYSCHAPETECIGKGKAHKPYEFGVKVSITTTNARAKGGMFILHAKALHGNPYDGHTLSEVVDELTDWVGARPERIYVDKGYRGHKLKAPLSVFRSGQKRGVTPQIKRELRRRAAVEPIIGHTKAEHRMDRNYLKGREGDRTNAVLAAAGYNFKQIANWLKAILCAWIIRSLWGRDQRLLHDPA